MIIINMFAVQIVNASRMKFFLAVSLSVLMCGNVVGQKNNNEKAVDALNNYVQFTNESIHGMMIIHRLLENFNQDINKYVDLDTYQIHPSLNNDVFPKDIFEDPEFYDVVPKEWFKKAKLNSRALSSDYGASLFGIANEMTNITKRINNMRFEIQASIDENDLNVKENLETVYDLLEQAVSHYNEFYALAKDMRITLGKAYVDMNISEEELEFGELMSSFRKMHADSWEIFDALRNKKDGDFERLIKNQKASYANFEKYEPGTGELRLNSKEYYRRRSNILSECKAIITSSERFFKTGEVDKDYIQYGKFYFYHNSDVINKFNRYGNGYVFDMNQLIEYLNVPMLQFLEVPHFYQVIYPRKLKSSKIIRSFDPEIEQLPAEVKDRSIRTADRIITVDSNIVEMKFFDHLIQDGDVVSISFNGDWILEKYSLEEKPATLTFELNKEGKNYILLHADSVGHRPPNTLGIKYTYKGKEEKILLESDLRSSELIEINLE